jgi:hypothetical protein
VGRAQRNPPSTVSEALGGFRFALPTLRFFIHHLARMGNMQDILQRAEHLTALDERYRPFAEQLSLLAKGYLSKSILNLVKQYQGEDHLPREAGLSSGKGMEFDLPCHSHVIARHRNCWPLTSPEGRPGSSPLIALQRSIRSFNFPCRRPGLPPSATGSAKHGSRVL